MKSCLIILFMLFVFWGCRVPSIKEEPPKAVMLATAASLFISSGDTSLKIINGQWFYQEKPFTGVIQKKYPGGRLMARKSVVDGLEEGWQYAYYPDGTTESKRFYHQGEKDSVNMGWWPNGKMRYAYHFKKGVYEGDFDEWYQSGNPLKHIVYHNGKEQSGKGWRENGKIYMSFVLRNGRLYGLINSNLCYSLKNEQGEFIPSAPEKKSPL